VTAPRRLSLYTASAAIGLMAAGWCSAASAVPIGVTSVASQAAQRDTLRVAATTDAWYASSPLSDICLPVLPCLSIPLPTSTYPSGTLHVGVTLGKETARSYVTLPIRQPATTLTGATGALVLPIADSVTDRTIEPASASILVCLTTTRIKSVFGATTNPPAVDCSASAHARYDAPHHRFTVNLRPFLRDWAQGVPNDGLALLAVTTSAKITTVWQVSFPGRTAPNSSRVAALITLNRSEQTPTSSPAPSSNPSPAPLSMSVPPAVPLPPATETEPGTGGQPPQIAATSPPHTANTGFVSRAYLNSSIFLVPLALLASAIFFGRLFTADPLTGRRKRS
jgi:hypothetical protein